LSMSTSVSSATHTATAHDDFTGYEAPTGIKFEWEGESNAVGGGKVTAVVEKPLSIEVGQGGLIEKVRWPSLFCHEIFWPRESHRPDELGSLDPHRSTSSPRSRTSFARL
jgi:hypothetical protein